MIRVIPILFGALFTAVTAWSLGMLLFRRLSLVFYAWEERLLAFVAGSACLSGIMLVLSISRLVFRGILLALGLAIIGYAVYSGALRFKGKRFPPLAPLWRWFFVISFAAFTYFGFFSALAPEHSTDGMAYHLGEVLKYRQAHGFVRITTDIYSNLSQGVELLYLFAFDFGRHSAASVLHFTFLLVLAFLILSYGRRIGRPERGRGSGHLHLRVSGRAAGCFHRLRRRRACGGSVRSFLSTADLGRKSRSKNAGAHRHSGRLRLRSEIYRNPGGPLRCRLYCLEAMAAEETGAAAGAGGLASGKRMHPAVDGEKLDRSRQSRLAAGQQHFS